VGVLAASVSGLIVIVGSNGSPAQPVSAFGGRVQLLALRREHQEGGRVGEFEVFARRVWFADDPSAFAETLPAACVVVARIAWSAPDGDFAAEDLHRLRGVVDAHVGAVVFAGAHGGVQDDGDVGGLEAEARRLARSRDQVEHRHRVDLEAQSDRIVVGHHCDADRRVLGTRVDVVRVLCAEAHVVALLHGIGIAKHVGVADEPGRQLEGQVLL